MPRLIIVSNRLPVSIARLEDGGFSYNESVGGVATGISSLSEPKERLWFGWPGIPSDELTVEDQTEVCKTLNDKGCHPVHLSEEHIRDFYSGFSNDTIWPLFHYFPQYIQYNEDYWQSYKQVNQLFCDEIIDKISEDDIIWVHDYQLMLLPQMIRERLPKAHIGFFLHIPFPSFELLRNLPWRQDILNGLLGSDLIGFHEYDYVCHFLSSVYRICGHEHHFSELMIENRHVRIDAFPMGINYDKYVNSGIDDTVKGEIENLGRQDTKLILSVDRLDYTKGILHRLEAYEVFLKDYPEYHGKVTLGMIAVPSRTKVPQYALLRSEIEKSVGRINGDYGTLNWTPVQYMYRSLPFEQLTAMYHRADIALITPLRDGMNLVAKEFVATQKNKAEDNQGVLILSEMAGAACELSEALVINPFDKKQMVEAIITGLEMPQEERLRRNLMMQSRISTYTVARWANDFIESLNQVKDKQNSQATKQFKDTIQQQCLKDYQAADKRLIVLDYDGTLVGFQKLPEDAKPDRELLDIMEGLTRQAKNEIVVISGRDQDTLCDWLGHLNINIVAEHGAFFRVRGLDWESIPQPDKEWKDFIKPIFDLYVDRTAGSFVEEKASALVWHCRKSEPDLAKLRIQELKDALMMMATNLNLGVFEGNKIVEVKPVSINKGHAVQRWLDKRDWPCIFCAGDDYTDEDMFSVLPDHAISCKIGTGPSNAKYRLGSPQKLRRYLKQLANI